MRSTRIMVVGFIAAACFLAAAMPASAQGTGSKSSTKAKAAEKAAEAAPAQVPEVKLSQTPSGAAAAPAAAAPGGQYKIGVVSRQQVLKKYSKVTAEYDKLQEKVKTEQVDIDKLSDKIDQMKKDYEAQKASMSPEDRATKEAEIQKEYSQYRYLLDTKQREIDTEEQRLMKTVLAEVDEVVSKIAAEQGYHLVLEGSSGRSSVMYYSPTIDITQRVVDELNNKK